VLLLNFFQSTYSVRADVYTKSDSGSNHNNISLRSVSADEVFQSIKRIKSNYVQGPDGIPAFFVKDCASVLSQPMSILFNIGMKMKTGTFPEIWKISKILPTHKAKDIGCSFNILAASSMEIFCFCEGMSSFVLPVIKIRVELSILTFAFRQVYCLLVFTLEQKTF
jgi:hypothetical protein